MGLASSSSLMERILLALNCVGGRNPPHRILRGELTSVTETQIDAFLAEVATIIDAPPPLPNCPPVAAGHKGNGQVSSPMPIPPCAVSAEQRSHMENVAKRSLENIANAPRGTSNDTINKEAHTLAGLVAAGLPADGLREYALEVALVRAAKGGNDRRETHATFESGWAHGLNSPWVPGAGMPAEAARASAAPHLARLAAQRAANDSIKTGGGENACAESGRESTINSLPTRRNRFVLEPWKSITHDKTRNGSSSTSSRDRVSPHFMVSPGASRALSRSISPFP